MSSDYQTMIWFIIIFETSAEQRPVKSYYIHPVKERTSKKVENEGKTKTFVKIF